jgi:nitrate/nitrite transporter NarK
MLAIVMQVARLGSVKAHKLSSKIGQIRSIQILYIIFTICCISLTFTSNAAVTVVSIVVICGSSSVIAPMILDIENKSIGSFDRATMLSIFSMFGDLTGAGMNVVIGKTADISLKTAFAACVFICICAYVLFIIYKKKSDYNSSNAKDDTMIQESE